MKQHSKLAAAQAQVGEQQATQMPVAREFSDADELLRFDAAQTPVPPAIAARLQQTAAPFAPAPAPWWRRLCGR